MNGYVITDESNKVWLCKDKSSYTLSTDSNRACIFDSKSKAESTFESLPKIIKGKGVKVKSIKLQIDDEGITETTNA